MIVVDPKTGTLWIESDSNHIWKGDHWEGIDLQDSKYGFIQSNLITVQEDIGKKMYIYDENNRIVLIRYPDGEEVRIRYQTEGKVSRIEGGAGNLWNLTWGKALVVVQEGRPTVRLSYEQKTDGYSLSVTESTGRMVQSAYKNDVLQYWVDPLGSRTDLKWEKNHLTVQKDDGRIWQIGFDSNQYLTSLSLPDTSAWVWKRSAKGGLQSQIDPIGREIHFEIDENNRIKSSSALSTLTYHRDVAGHITKVDDIMGIRFRLVWEEGGRITTIQDATESKIHFAYDAHQKLHSITDRAGNSWFLERDRFGLLTRIITPDKSVWSIQRNAKGYPIQLKTPFSVLDMPRDFRDQVSLIKLNGNEEISFVRDRSGNVLSLRYRDQIIQKWEWNHIREPVSLWTSKGKQQMSRDAAGWITSWADFTCNRDALGRIESIVWNDQKYEFMRDTLGRIQKIKKSLYELSIQYDRNDLPILWKESNGASSDVQRNERGQIIKGDDIHISYDAKGWIQTARMEERIWRWSRDIAGRVLQMIAPGGSKLGFDHTEHGLLTFIRYPDSTIQRFFRQTESLETRLIASDSTLLDQIWYFWNQYGLVVEKKKGDTRTFFRRDPSFEIVAVERSDGLIWSKTLDGIHDGMNGKAIFSFDGDVIGVQPPVGSYPYGQELGYLAYHRDEAGKIIELIDAQDQAQFSYDKLDRLRGICFRKEGCWKFFYDPRGMLSGFVSPTQPKQKLFWRPDIGVGEFSHSVLLAVGSQSWLDGPNGLLVSEEDNRVMSFVFDPMGTLTWVLTEEREQPFPSLAFTYMGEVAPVFGQGNTIHLGAAGPVFQGDIAYEPFSAQRFDGIAQDSDFFDKPYHRLPALKYDKVRSFWREPLHVLEELSLMPLFESRLLFSSSEPLVHWLPMSYSEKQEIGIHGQDLLVDGSQHYLVNLYWDVVFRGKKDPSSELIIKAILQHEFQDDWLTSDIVDKIIWWNSDTKLDPRLANIFFLE